jgi:hypothetical protein
MRIGAFDLPDNVEAGDADAMDDIDIDEDSDEMA